MSMYASATCSTSDFFHKQGKRFESVSFEACILRCPSCRNSVACEFRVIPLEHVCFCYLFYIRLLPQTGKRFDSVSFAACRLRCPGCRNIVAFEFRVIPIELVCFCYLFHMRLLPQTAKRFDSVIFHGIPTSMARLTKSSCL